MAKIKRKIIKKQHFAYEVNEAYSTKASVCCHEHSNKCMKNGRNPKTYKNNKYNYYPTEIHGILICKKCGRTWNRDVVGAINILNIFLEEQYYQQPRPYRFTKQCYTTDN